MCDAAKWLRVTRKRPERQVALRAGHNHTHATTTTQHRQAHPYIYLRTYQQPLPPVHMHTQAPIAVRRLTCGQLLSSCSLRRPDAEPMITARWACFKFGAGGLENDVAVMLLCRRGAPLAMVGRGDGCVATEADSSLEIICKFGTTSAPVSCRNLDVQMHPPCATYTGAHSMRRGSFRCSRSQRHGHVRRTTPYERANELWRGGASAGPPVGARASDT